jgi:hypothetical protein
MSEVVLIEFCGEAFALTREQLDEARLRARELLPPAQAPASKPVEQIVDAAALAVLTSLPQSWLEEQGRRGTVPCLSLGKYRRFVVADAIAAIRKLGRGP